MLTKVKYGLKKLFIPESNLGELGRKYNQILGFSIITAVPIIFFVIYGVVTSQKDNEIILYSSLVALIINGLLLIKTKKTQICSVLFTSSVAALFFTLLITGGENGSGFLWFYTFPLFTFFLLGYKNGGRVMLLVILTIAFYLYSPLFALYSVEPINQMSLRFLVSLSLVSALAYFYEVLREHTVEELLSLSRKFDKRSLIDPLTGVANRREADEMLIKEMSRFKRNHSPITVVKVNFDHFSVINEKYGNKVGDDSLKFFAQLLKRELRIPDFLARYQKEEFLIILPDTDLEAALLTIDRVQSDVRDTKLNLDEGDISLTASFGIHTPNLEETIQEVLHCCDQKLYKAKVDGRDMIVYK